MPALKPVVPVPGQSLYISVRDHLLSAIEAGIFQPGVRLPSTMELSEKLGVSLVTTHRALLELTNAGILRRAQGRGTFVHERFADRGAARNHVRIGLVLDPVVNLADDFHGNILEGLRRSTSKRGADWLLLDFGEDIRNECDGVVVVNPEQEAIAVLRRSTGIPMVIVGARFTDHPVPWIDVDNMDLAIQAVEHLAGLGHVNIGFVGGAMQLCHSRDRWNGFSQATMRRGLFPPDSKVIIGGNYVLESGEMDRLTGLLKSRDRPSAIFAAGFGLATNVYHSAKLAGLRIPDDLSVVGVDDPHDAAHLDPPLTTFRQPIQEMSAAAGDAMCEFLLDGKPLALTRLLPARFIQRGSTSRGSMSGAGKPVQGVV
jgi:GntR family transcriptional regulator, arabinose operon transcriptional repressor